MFKCHKKIYDRDLQNYVADNNHVIYSWQFSDNESIGIDLKNFPTFDVPTISLIFVHGPSDCGNLIIYVLILV